MRRGARDLIPLARPPPPDSITALPCSLAFLLRSTVHLPSLTSIVSHLVHNSLDAGAHDVRVRLDLDACEVECADDGCGFGAGILTAHGLRRYATHHQHRSSIRYGRRGEALASMAAIGLLRVESRNRDASEGASSSSHTHTHTHIQRGDDVVYSGPSPSASSAPLLSPHHGSCVTLKDIYHALPLRRPSKMSESQRRRELEGCRRAMERIALREPEVRFELRSGASQRVLFRCGAVNGVLAARFSALAGIDIHDCLTATSADDDDGSQHAGFHVAVVVAPSAPPTATTHQYVYIQGGLLPRDVPYVEFAAANGDVQTSSASLPSTRFSTSSLSLHNRIRRIVGDRIPFVVDVVSASSGQEEAFPEDEQALGDVVCRIMQRAMPASTDSTAQATTKMTMERVNVGDDGADCNASHHGTLLGKRRHSAQSLRSRTRPSTPTLPMVFPALLKPSHAQRFTARRPATSPAHTPQYCEYTDASTGKTYDVDLRTGNSYLRSRGDGDDNDGQKALRAGWTTLTRSHSASTRLTCRPLSAQQSSNGGAAAKQHETAPPAPVQATSSSLATSPSSAPPSWLQEVITKWENPVFPRGSTARDEPPIPTLSPCDALSSRHDRARDTRRAQSLALPHLQLKSALFARTQPGNDRNPSPSLPSQRPVTSESLDSARVIAQVSCKFIAALIPTTGIILAIDQHAADERVRYEAILDEYAREGDVYALKQPVSVPLNCTYVDELLRDDGDGMRSTALAQWGFAIRVSDDGDGSNDNDDEADLPRRHVAVSHVPAILADRLRSDVAALARILDEILSAPFSTPTKRPTSWPHLLATIPPSLLDLIKSKACRGAVMFNDVLTVEQCQRLVGQLAMCKFPFGCAHGRPTVAPLCDSASATGRRESAVRWAAVLDL